MSLEYCRLCLKSNNLKPIFIDISRHERYSTVLALTTGLQIHYNDGLPQKICRNCTKSVNHALQLRNQSFKTEKQLLKLGFIKHCQKKTKIKKEKGTKAGKAKNYQKLQECKEENEKSIVNISLPEFEVEVELDRITEELKAEELNLDKKNTEKSLEKKIKTRKERKEAYLNLVEGNFDPKGPVKCKICKKELSKWATFVCHAQKHLGFKFVCEYCGKSFISSTQLNRHCRSQHGMERTLKCKHCDYIALDNAQLVLHERRVHTGLRPFTCELCSASYHSRRCLRQHVESHNAYATVQCDSCPKLFKSRRHLARHKYATHRCKQFTYRCPVCAHDYRNRKYIAVHLKKAHGVSSKDVKIVKIKL